MAIQWFDNRSNRGVDVFISIDAYQRLHLSVQARELLGLSERSSVSAYIGYDKEEKTIALIDVKNLQLRGKRPMKFDGERYYCSARNFVDANQLSTEAHRYYYIGNDEETGACLFQHESLSHPTE